jgi:CheY-like chemotaxis protein
MTQTPARKPTVLIVDDTPANLGVLFELLSTAGLEVLVAKTAPVPCSAPPMPSPD